MVVLMLCYFIRIMDPTSSLGRVFLGENVYGSSSEKVEGHGDWNAPEYTNTAGSKEKKVTKALSFYKMETDEVSERYITLCFVNGLKAYDGEINLALDENLISNEYAVKLCLDYEVKKGNKVLKKELIVALKGELYFVKFIINPKGNDAEARSSRSKCSRQYETEEEDILNEIGCDGEIDDMLRIKLHEAKTNEEIFTSMAWVRAFNIKELIYLELCHEFYSTYEFDEVYADDELQTKKIIKFRLGGRAHNLTLLEFTRRLGLYHAEELEEDALDVYFQGGLCSDDHFNAYDFEGGSQDDHLWLVSKDYWYDKIQKNDLWLLSMSDARHQNGYASVAWLITRRMKRKGVGTQRESQICYGQFITKIVRKARVLNDVVLRSLSALIYCRDLDTTTLRELIDSKGRVIPEDPQLGVPRVGIPRPREHQCKTCTRGWHMGSYNPPGYAQPQYDQYYQQYPPQPPQYPPQYQQQQQDDDE
ncbi:hypothetical protein Tco_0439053 [Tanacetum coccineum]